MTSRSAQRSPAWLIVAAGVCAALHVAKLPPAITALRESLAITLVQAGFLLSLVQLAGMGLAVAVGAWADGWGARRSMLAGLALLGAASLLGSLAQDVATLMVLRAVEGFAFLLVVLPGPGWIRASVGERRATRVLGLWGTYMPLATTLALLVGPAATAAFGWQPWWAVLGALSMVMALLLATLSDAPLPGAKVSGLFERLRATLSARGPWLVAAVFGLYAFQWMAVIGFLPTLVLEAGHSAAATGMLTAAVAAVNALGNLGAGRLLHRGVAAHHLLALGLVVMALGCLALYAALPGWPPLLRYAGAIAFSLFGGLVPATLFHLAVQVAPSVQTQASTVGWMHQGSALGQFLGPPALAWLASAMGGWHFSAALTGAASLAALCLLPALQRCELQRGGAGRQSLPHKPR